MRKFYEVRILRHLKWEASAFVTERDAIRMGYGSLGEYLEKHRQDSGYIQQIASSPRVAANRAWAGSVRDRHLSPDEEVTITVRASEVTMDDR